MSRSRDDRWVSIWRDLPDPRDTAAPRGVLCVIHVPLSAWTHIVAKHVANDDEPWDELIGDQLRQRLIWLSPGTGDPDGWRQSLADTTERLEHSARASLGRPLVVLDHGAGDPSLMTWELILPEGATLIVRSHKVSGNVMVTCYFKGVACSERSPARRWLALARSYVNRHVEMKPGVGFVLPDAPEGCPQRVRFVTPESWGFRPDLDGCPWRGRFPDWDELVRPSPANPAKKRLRARYRLQEGKSHG